MKEFIKIRVLTNEGLALEDEAISVVAPGELGYLGVLRSHAPLVTTLSPGKLIYRTPQQQTKKVRIGSGLLEIVRNTLTILTDSVSQPETTAG